MSHILIVDDDSNNQRMLSYSLRKVGYDVQLASNGQAGLDVLKSQEINLAIIDLSMPIMDGLSLLRLIRADRVLSQLPVIILTASGDDDELSIAEKLGIEAFLTKPSSSRILLKLVANILPLSV
ncbi:MAG: response regulator [Chloroflexota bacterium]